jgi:hypothetical protein
VAIDGAARIEHVKTKSFGDGGGGLCPRCRDPVSQIVGIQARHAAVATLLEHVALARRDASGQGDS